MTNAEIGEQKEQYHVVIIRGDRKEAAQEIRQSLEALGFTPFPEEWVIGVTIAVHAGPTAVGICYIKKYEYLSC